MDPDDEHHEKLDAITRAARLLGLKLSQLDLDDSSSRTYGSSSWGFSGSTAFERLGCAVRAAVRDVGVDASALNAARDAADLILTELQKRSGWDGIPALPSGSSSSSGMSPEQMLRSGALGGRAAAALVSAVSPLSLEERQAGLAALQQITQEEVRRFRTAESSVMMSVCESSSGADELLLRCALIQALLDDRREAEALEVARYAAKFEATSRMSFGNSMCPGVSLLLGRCLLRLGHRADGLAALEMAEADPQAETCTPSWLYPVYLWGRAEAKRLMVSFRAAERCRQAAVDAYACGSFTDAATLFGKAIAILQNGFPDDKRGRAAVLADRAGCLRRARQLDAAIVDLDAALCLFPRFSRALFRRAACLLESGKADAAIEGFKDLYRVDRDWPMLSEWLIRAYTLRKRQAKGYRREGLNDDDDDARPASVPTTGKADADAIAVEVDHYAVLGVTVDATEKQLKTAYRMRSLQFHPDRKEGHTAAFQRIAEAYEILSDADKRSAYDMGGDIKVKRGRRDEDDDSEEEDEEHKTSMREEDEREYYPERYQFWPFGKSWNIFLSVNIHIFSLSY